MAECSWTVACVQMASGADWQGNLEKAFRFANQALEKKPKLIAFPENFSYRGGSRNLDQIVFDSHQEVLEVFKKLSRTSKTNFLLGSLLEPTGIRSKFYNTSFLISPSADVVRYRKIHLFDSKIKNASTQESKSIAQGKKWVKATVDGKGCGLTICYDLRFPELFRKLAFSGCEIICVPSNFTYETGKAHWEVLLKARAIENQVFVLAPAQCGTNPHTRLRSYGNTMIIDPWGQILSQSKSSEQEGIVFANLDFKDQRLIRKSLPVLEHAALKKL